MAVRSVIIAGLFPFFAACVEFEPETPERAYIAPMDGQTGVPTSLPLLVRTGDFRVPPFYQTPDFIVVTDLEDGGDVPGIIEVTADALTFRPRGFWRANRRYAWAIPSIQAATHGPDLPMPDHLPGTAVFDTSDSLELLGASQNLLEEELCLLFSRPLTDQDRGAIRITVDDVEIASTNVRLIPPEDWGKPYELFENDPGVDVLCTEIDGDTDVVTDTDGASQIRVWWGDEGPWIAAPLVGPIFDVALQRRRGNW